MTSSHRFSPELKLHILWYVAMLNYKIPIKTYFTLKAMWWFSEPIIFLKYNHYILSHRCLKLYPKTKVILKLTQVIKKKKKKSPLGIESGCTNLNCEGLEEFPSTSNGQPLTKHMTCIYFCLKCLLGCCSEITPITAASITCSVPTGSRRKNANLKNTFLISMSPL